MENFHTFVDAVPQKKKIPTLSRLHVHHHFARVE